MRGGIGGGVAVFEGAERGCGATALAAAFSKRERCEVVLSRVGATSMGTLLKRVSTRKLVAQKRRASKRDDEDAALERTVALAPERGSSVAARRVLVVVDDLSLPHAAGPCPSFLRARHGTAAEWRSCPFGPGFAIVL